MSANFLTGPVAMKAAVLAAFHATPTPHRDRAFLATFSELRSSLRSMARAADVAVMLGSGTLANDAVAAQLSAIATPGLILSNGEFGERLVDHAKRWRLECSIEMSSWGDGFDWHRLRSVAETRRPRWIWAVLTETSTGISNPLPELHRLRELARADLCLDAISAVGVMPVDLRGVRFATAVSGKGLAAPSGLALVFHDGRLAPGAQLPRYLDLRQYEAAGGVPFTHSSNLVSALACSLKSTDWARKFERVRQLSRGLRAALARQGLAPLVGADVAAPGVFTLAIDPGRAAGDVAALLRQQGIEVGFQSTYLRRRNWLQIALMGEVNEPALHRLPVLLAAAIRGRPAPAWRHRPFGPVPAPKPAAY